MREFDGERMRENVRERMMVRRNEGDVVRMRKRRKKVSTELC